MNYTGSCIFGNGTIDAHAFFILNLFDKYCRFICSGRYYGPFGEWFVYIAIQSCHFDYLVVDFFLFLFLPI